MTKSTSTTIKNSSSIPPKMRENLNYLNELKFRNKKYNYNNDEFILNINKNRIYVLLRHYKGSDEMKHIYGGTVYEMGKFILRYIKELEKDTNIISGGIDE